MLGLSTFFSSTFHNLLQAQEQTQISQQQFTSGEIFREKLRHVKTVLPGGSSASNILFQSDEKGVVSFNYIAKSGTQLAFKDLMIFNGIKDGNYLDSGAGKIKRLSDETEVLSGVTNASSFVANGSIYYVVFPLENKVQKCESGACIDWITSGLSAPTDIITDGTSFYVTDSGNNRVVKIDATGTTFTEIASGLNFPTGIAYSTTGSSPTLFVADTLNNLVKKINIADKKVTTIAGSGESTACDNTALYCKLNMPTGLSVQDNSLYIADSGSGRVLKVSDPGTLLSYDFAFTLDNPTYISKVTFTFPDGSAGISDITEGLNDLHKAIYRFSGNAMTSDFSTTLSQDTSLTYCTNPAPSGPPVCTLGFVTVQGGENIFNANGEYLKIGSGSPWARVDHPENNDVYFIENETTHSYPAGTIIRLFKEFAEDPFEWHLNFIPGTATLPNLFNTVKMEIYDQTPAIVQTQYFILRQGDGVLGTAEDKIEVVKDTGLNFPTGVTDAYVASSLDGQIIPFGVGSSRGLNYLDPGSISQFDYATSGFTVTGLNFHQYGVAPYQILEATIGLDFGNGKTKEYKIDAPL